MRQILKAALCGVFFLRQPSRPHHLFDVGSFLSPVLVAPRVVSPPLPVLFSHTASQAIIAFRSPDPTPKRGREREPWYHQRMQTGRRMSVSFPRFRSCKRFPAGSLRVRSARPPSDPPPSPPPPRCCPPPRTETGGTSRRTSAPCSPSTTRTVRPPSPLPPLRRSPAPCRRSLAIRTSRRRCANRWGDGNGRLKLLATAFDFGVPLFPDPLWIFSTTSLFRETAQIPVNIYLVETIR